MQFTINTDKEFLCVKAWGREIDRAPSEMCAAVLGESGKQDRKRILIELNQKVPLSPTSQHALVARLPELGFTHEHRIALVHSTVEMQEASDFINLLGQNRGVMVRNFSGLDAAKAWLRE